MAYQQQRDAILADPSVSFFLKDALRKLDQRDALDAYYDAKMLLTLATARADERDGGPYWLDRSDAIKQREARQNARAAR